MRQPHEDPASDDGPAPPAQAGEAVHEAPPPGNAGDPGAAQAEPEAEAPPAIKLTSILESLLFVADRPLTLDRLRELLLGQDPQTLREALSSLEQDYLAGGRGIQLHQVAGGYQLRTAPQNAAYVQQLLQKKPVRLSRAQLETLAIISYRQPITRPEIDDIRGVDSAGTLKVLLERHLVRILGKKEEPGRPLLYGTTKDFLEFFNLRDLKDLPTLREYYELSDEHQAQVNSMSAALEDLADKGSVEPPEPVPPPPLTRVELADLKLDDDEEQLSQIDQMIDSVRTDVKLDLGAPPPAAPKTAPPAAPDQNDDREPEEL